MHLELAQRSVNDVASARSAHLDQGVREEGCRRAGMLDCTVSVTEHGDVTEVVIDRRAPIEGAGPAAKLFGATMRIVQTERWRPVDDNGVSGADIAVAFPGAPIAMTAVAVIEPRPDGSLETITGEVKVKVPVIGRAVEPEVVKQITRSLRIELETGLEWLANRT